MHFTLHALVFIPVLLAPFAILLMLTFYLQHFFSIRNWEHLSLFLWLYSIHERQCVVWISACWNGRNLNHNGQVIWWFLNSTEGLGDGTARSWSCSIPGTTCLPQAFLDIALEALKHCQDCQVWFWRTSSTTVSPWKSLALQDFSNIIFSGPCIKPMPCLTKYCQEWPLPLEHCWAVSAKASKEIKMLGRLFP